MHHMHQHNIHMHDGIFMIMTVVVQAFREFIRKWMIFYFNWDYTILARIALLSTSLG